MWIASTLGFYSFVKKGKDYYHIRGRDHRDLHNLVKAANLDRDVIYGGGTDYGYRIIVDERDKNRCVKAIEDSINYPNFKNAIHASPTQRSKGDAYMEIWAVMYDHQCQREAAKDLDRLAEIFAEVADEAFKGNFPFDDDVPEEDESKYLSAFDDDEPMSRATLKEWDDFEAEIAKLRS